MKFHPSNHSFFNDVTVTGSKDLSEVEVFLLAYCKDQVQDKSIVVDDGLEPSEVIEQVTQRKMRHIVQKNGNRFSDSLESAAKLVGDPKRYFESRFCFFENKQIATFHSPFSGSADKENLRTQINAFVEQIGSASVSESVISIFEELYMNAIMDAPREAKKKGVNESRQASEIFLCRTEDWLQISCMDHYGSLDIENFLKRLQQVYNEGAGEVINMDQSSGAGLGCMILFEQSACMILGVDPGLKTKVSCFIPLKMNNRQRTQMKKSLHWFEL